MNCGFSNLDTLKKRLKLPEGDAQFDDVVAAIGLGLAGSIEQFCQRKFALQQVTESFGADRIQFLLSRTPLLSLDKTEFKQDETTGFVEQDSTFIQSIDSDNGVIYLPDGNDPGKYWSTVRFTYTGGYWWEMLEPDDEAYPSQITAGAAALPDELKNAWLTICERVWSKRDKLGLALVDKPDAQSMLDDFKLGTFEKQTLSNFVKFNLT